MKTYSVNLEVFLQASDTPDLLKRIEKFIRQNPDIRFWKIGTTTRFDDKVRAGT